MKKLALMLIVLMALGGAVFAEITAALGDVTVSGNVASAIGYDLEGDGTTGYWGISGTSDINVQVPFITGGAGASGSDDLYGEIALTGVALKWDETNTWQDDDYDGVDFKGSIAAKIVAGNIFVGLNAAGFNANNAVGTGALDVNAVAVADGGWLAIGGSGSLVFGYNDGSMSFDVEFAPKGGITRYADNDNADGNQTAWDGATTEVDDVAADQNVNGEFVLGADASITAGPLTLPINFVLDSTYAVDTQLMILGAAPVIAAGDITVNIPLDFIMKGDDSGFDVAPSLSYALNADGSSVGLAAYYYSATVATVATDYAQLGITVTEPMTGGLADGIGADLAIDLTDLTGTTLGWNVALGLDIALGAGMTLYLDPDYGSDEIFNLGAGLILGADATGIDNTTVTIGYGSAQFGGASNSGILSAKVSIAF